MNEKVLIIDDTYINISILTEILESEGYTVFSASSGFSVVDMARKVQPDVILLDIVMPGLDGFEVCKLLNCAYDLKDIPVIMVTAKTEGIDIKNALELGAFDYIKKPIDKNEVIARLQSTLRLIAYQNKLKELAMKDGLTGLFNHAAFMELFEKELAKHQRNNRNLSYVMIDIDFFKKINDTYGHIAGNVILKELSNILLNTVRKGDIVCRYGGEEFSIVLPETNKEDAYQLCQRIRQKIEKYTFDIGNETVKVTVSIGIFSKELNDTLTKSEIVQLADKELYKAKCNGRNQVHVC
jgi:diguanylate cyclase (GGDEF)-like protein